jgi:hypothetical protein
MIKNQVSIYRAHNYYFLHVNHLPKTAIRLFDNLKERTQNLTKEDKLPSLFLLQLSSTHDFK